MSRIGRLPITIPAGVDVTIDGQNVAVKGPKGTLTHTVPAPITVETISGAISIRAATGSSTRSTSSSGPKSQFVIAADSATETPSSPPRKPLAIARPSDPMEPEMLATDCRIEAAARIMSRSMSRVADREPRCSP